MLIMPSSGRKIQEIDLRIPQTQSLEKDIFQMPQPETEPQTIKETEIRNKSLVKTRSISNAYSKLEPKIHLEPVPRTQVETIKKLQTHSQVKAPINTSNDIKGLELINNSKRVKEMTYVVLFVFKYLSPQLHSHF